MAQESFKDTIKKWHSLIDELNCDYIAGGSFGESFWRTVLFDCKVIGYHEGLTLQNNPRDRRRRLDKVDNAIPPTNRESEEKLIQALDKLATLSEGAQCSRRFSNTKKDYMGIGLPVTQNGDIVCVLPGGEVPYISRPCGNGQHTMVGQW